ncbi:UDP-N-acetylmuramoyl-tripeptide--D-alanyl-D-alanine ligase [Candidatus Uhrbacteria bacterium]|nr:UDP-N-acetylmuramoyl-tripeptide--D-alanyl-D-alanine ligase [Candidatus Uhrbacteria bacterium]
MKRILQIFLAHCAKRVIYRYKPFIVGITGSYGKTSLRLAIATVLKQAGYNVATPRENYNNEFGFPFGILDKKSPGRSATGWLELTLEALGMAYGKTRAYPKYLVLEYGADHHGDVARLCAIARPHAAIMTGVSAVHAEFFGTLEDVAREKSTLAKMVIPGGAVFVNADDAMRDQLVGGANAPIERYGCDVSADVQVREENLTVKPDGQFLPGETFATFALTITSKTQTYFVELKNIIGRPASSMVAGAIAVCERLGLSPEQILRGLEALEPTAGRLRLLPGIRGALIIDDTYNAAPAAMQAALETLPLFTMVGEARRIAVLGHMAELGQYHAQEHERIGKMVVELGIDLLVTAGEKARDIARAALSAGMAREHVYEFESPEEAGKWLDDNIRAGDVVLVKGSQSARMEKVVKEIMAEPLHANELLVRQYGGWVSL